MKPILTIELPEVSPSLNTIHGWNRYTPWKHDQYKKRTKDAVLWSALGTRSWKRATTSNLVKRFVRVTRFSSGTLDEENFSGGCKVIFDALVEADVLVDDAPKWVTREYVQAPKRRGVGIRIEVYGTGDA